MIDRTIGIIGCGNMGEALLSGLLRKNVVDEKNIIVSEKVAERLNSLKKQYSRITFINDNKSLVKNSQIIILAIKPQDMDSLLKEISTFLTTSHLIISIAAGIKISFIEKRLENTIPIVRAMPNLPAVISEGMSVYCLSKIVSKEDEKIVEEIFGSVGKILKLGEDKLDAVTALSGSGPAYVFYILETMMEAGIKLGFTEQQSKTLSVQTLIGAAKMIEKGENPTILRKKVTSPQGTTEAALKVLMDTKWKDALIRAIEKAERRSKELSKP